MPVSRLQDFNRGGQNEYAESSPLGADTETAYELATGPPVADTYDMASNVTAGGGAVNVYDTAGSLYKDVAPDADADAELADNDNIYSMASGPAAASAARGRGGDAIYDMGGGAKFDRSSAIYDFSTRRGSETDVDGLDSNGPVYDMGIQLGSSTDDQLYDNMAMQASVGDGPRTINLMADVPIYDIGTSTDPVSSGVSMEGKSLQLDAVYDMGGPGSLVAPDSDVITPAVYDMGGPGALAAPDSEVLTPAVYAMGGPGALAAPDSEVLTPAVYAMGGPGALAAPDSEVLTPAVYATEDGGLVAAAEPDVITPAVYDMGTGSVGPAVYDTAAPASMQEPEMEEDAEDADPGADDGSYLETGEYLETGDGETAESSVYAPRPGSIWIDASNSVRLKSVVRTNPLATMERARMHAEEDAIAALTDPPPVSPGSSADGEDARSRTDSYANALV